MWTGSKTPRDVAQHYYSSGTVNTACEDWTSANGTGVIGNMNVSDGVRFFADSEGPSCGTMHPVYCLAK